MVKYVCVLWLFFTFFIGKTAAAENLYFLKWNANADAVYYELEVSTSQGDILYDNDRVWQSEVIFPADIPEGMENEIRWRVRSFGLYGDTLKDWSEEFPFDTEENILERAAPRLSPDYQDGRWMRLLYPVYSFVGLPGAASYEIEVTDEEPENPDGTEPSEHRIWSASSEIMECYDESPRIGTYWWRVRCLDEDGNDLGVWSEARKMEMPTDGWTIGLFGDSISHGGGRMSYGPSEPMYNLVFYLTEPVVNLAQSGDTSRRMLERFDADVLPFHLQYLLIMGGTNSLRGGEDPEEVIADLQAIGDKCRENGIRPIYLTLAPINPENIKYCFNEDTATDWQDRFWAVNEWIRTQDHIDTASLFSENEALPPEYGQDGVHLDWEGKFLMARMINSALPKFME